MKADFPDKLQFLFEPHRYKVAYGGRGSGKSWSIARALLIQAAQRPLRILCARETMESIKESVHQLLETQIESLGLSQYYEVLRDEVRGKNGSQFNFAGLKHNVNNIKSLEACDICWIEEAQTVSEDSWKKLIPTIRKDGSEIWVSFNPELDTDETYKRFVVNPSPRAKTCLINWRDNPWFPKELKLEMEELKAKDHDEYEHIYEGATTSAVKEAVYKAELRAAELGGRICRVPYDATHPVHTFWDLGYGDMVSIWFAQAIAFEYRIIDYYENSRQAIDFYIQALQAKGYSYGTCVLPWDGGAKQLGSGRSIEELIRAKGYRTRVLPQWRVADGINAVRTIFPQCYFDSEKCADGLSGLRRYQWGPIPASGVLKREPLHDAASHPADALRCLAVWIKAPEKEKKEQEQRILRPPRLQGAYSPFG